MVQTKESPLRDDLEMVGIQKSYGGTQALRGVDFSAQRGEVHAIAGENGAGKTTLVKILTGAILADKGSIFLSGVETNIETPSRAHRLGIRSVHQQFSLVPNLSVTENVLLGSLPSARSPWCVDWRSAHKRAAEILSSIGLGSLDVRRMVADLSVAQQQMVEIAKAIAENPRIIILDEPSAVLTKRELDHLFGLIRRLKSRSVIVLYISHRLDEVFEISDRVTVLKDGQSVGTVRTAETDKRSLVRMMIGRTLEEVFPTGKPTSDTPVLTVTNLCALRAFHDVSFSIREGEVLGLYGLVGSGRTEVARCVFGADRTESGEIRMRGRPIGVTSPRSALASGIAMLTEDRVKDGLVLFMSTLDNASLASLRRFSRGGVLNQRQRRNAVSEMTQTLKIRPENVSIPVRTLSGGNQQKVVFAKWLLVNADILILDEPTRGVDVATKHEIYTIIRNLADGGAAVLLISSEMPEVLGMSDRVLVMREGKIVAELDRSEATEERLLATAVGIKPEQGGFVHE